MVNLAILEENFQDGERVDVQVLQQRGLAKKSTAPLKILASGELTKKLTVVADKFSAAAREKITAAGGTCQETSEANEPA